MGSFLEDINEQNSGMYKTHKFSRISTYYTVRQKTRYTSAIRAPSPFILKLDMLTEHTSYAAAKNLLAFHLGFIWIGKINGMELVPIFCFIS